MKKWQWPIVVSDITTTVLAWFAYQYSTHSDLLLLIYYQNSQGQHHIFTVHTIMLTRTTNLRGSWWLVPLKLCHASWQGVTQSYTDKLIGWLLWVCFTKDFHMKIQNQWKFIFAIIQFACNNHKILHMHQQPCCWCIWKILLWYYFFSQSRTYLHEIQLEILRALVTHTLVFSWIG